MDRGIATLATGIFVAAVLFVVVLGDWGPLIALPLVAAVGVLTLRAINGR